VKSLDYAGRIVGGNVPGDMQGKFCGAGSLENSVVGLRAAHYVMPDT